VIRVRRPNANDTLDPATRRSLAARHRAARGYPARDQRIERAWANFLHSAARDRVAEALDGCFRFKCAYCEQVAAKDIEHFFPKTDYPGRMFRWDNFLRGCKNCNNAKRDQFPTYRRSPILLNPCEDDPLDYFEYDFLTGMAGVNPQPERHRRGVATRDLFQSDQEPLREERRLKLLVVTYLLARVLQENPVSDETGERLRQELLPSRPWLGIVRQLLQRPGPKYQPLVQQAIAKLPAIATWASDWL
jgi:uncharacterized protein (TIGR02646 family)